MVITDTARAKALLLVDKRFDEDTAVLFVRRAEVKPTRRPLTLAQQIVEECIYDTQTLTLRTDRGEDNNWASGAYYWVDAKITLPAGSTVTRMETVPFSFSGNENKYWVGEKQGGGAVADFWNASLNTWRYFTTKNLISGHQNHSSVNGGDAFVSWDISNYGAGYFTVTACNNTAYDLVNQHFYGQFSILVDGVEQTASAVMEVTDGLWKGTVAVPADAQTIKVVINNGGDEHTCGAFTVADPIFVADPLGSAPTSDVTVSAAVASVVLGTLALVVCRGKKKKG